MAVPLVAMKADDSVVLKADMMVAQRVPKLAELMAYRRVDRMA